MEATWITATACTLVTAVIFFLLGLSARHIDKRETQKAQARQVPISAQTQQLKAIKPQSTPAVP